jgi:APA family basic amino acid/polyamine antiporter
MSALICVSALGVINGLIFAGSRISYAVGLEHRGFKALGKWDHRTGTPVRALLVQAAISVCLILVLGSFVDTIIYTAAPVYTFYLATSLAVIVLRHKEPGARRPYRVTGYPVTTLAFSAVCAFLVYSAVVYKPAVAIASVGLLALGLPIYYFTNRGSEPKN